MSNIIDGPNIILREGLTDEAYARMLTWFTDLEVMQYSWFGGKIKDVLNFKTTQEIKGFCGELIDGKFFLIFYRPENKLIGYVALSEFSKDKCEFGIYIGEKEYWERGIGSETTRLMVNYAFSRLGLSKVVLSTSEFHARAIGLYQKIGFKQTKIKPRARTIFYKGEWVKSDTVIMEIAKDGEY